MSERKFVEYDGPGPDTKRIYINGGEPPYPEVKVQRARDFLEMYLPSIVERLLRMRAARGGVLAEDEMRQLLHDMRDAQQALIPFERMQNLAGSSFVDDFTAARDAVQAAWFGDKSGMGRVSKLLGFVESRFRTIYEAAEDAARKAAVAPAAGK